MPAPARSRWRGRRARFRSWRGAYAIAGAIACVVRPPARSRKSSPMTLTRRLIATLLALAALVAADLVAAQTATAQTTKITFILVNDIYIMGDQAMPDGQRRGGFARLAAIVKAER